MFYHFIMGWQAGNSLFQGFPRAFLGLEQAGSPNLPFFLFIKGRAFLLTPREKADKFIFSKYEKIL